MTRVALAIKTNRGGTWILPIVRILRENGAEVRCYVADEPGSLADDLEALGATTFLTPALGGRGLPSAATALPALARDIRSFRPNVINYHLYRTALVFRALSFVTPRARLVHSVPGPLFLESRAVRAVERLLARRDDLIVCTAEVTEVAYTRLGVNPVRLLKASYPLDLSRWYPISTNDRQQARQAIGLPDDAFVAVMVAYFYAPRRFVLGGKAVKGHDLALDAWRRYRESGGDGNLLLVGGGFGESGAEYRASLLDCYPDLEDLGVRTIDSVSDVRAYYAAADVSIAPSRSENLGSAAEASALGVPSVAANVGGLPELVIPGVTGWLVRPDDPGHLASTLLDVRRQVRVKSLDSMRHAARTRVEAVCGIDAVRPLWLHALLANETSDGPSGGPVRGLLSSAIETGEQMPPRGRRSHQSWRSTRRPSPTD